MTIVQSKKVLIKRIGIVLVALIVILVISNAVFYFITAQLGAGGFVMLAGALGSIVFFLRRFSHLREAELLYLNSSWWGTLIPVIMGAVMGLVLYVIFMAGLLTGDGGGGLFTSNLFPNFTRPTVPDGELLAIKTIFTVRPESVQDFGKLMVWCFLSGYSERIVPDILASLERRGREVIDKSNIPKTRQNKSDYDPE